MTHEQLHEQLVGRLVEGVAVVTGMEVDATTGEHVEQEGVHPNPAQVHVFVTTIPFMYHCVLDCCDC